MAENCIICLDNYTNNTLIQKLYCNHIFHKDCIIKWLSINAVCPICNSEQIIIRINDDHDQLYILIKNIIYQIELPISYIQEINNHMLMNNIHIFIKNLIFIIIFISFFNDDIRFLLTIIFNLSDRISDIINILINLLIKILIYKLAIKLNYILTRIGMDEIYISNKIKYLILFCINYNLYVLYKLIVLYNTREDYYYK